MPKLCKKVNILFLPLLFLHYNYFRLTGKGCSCHFLYGPDTEDDHKEQIEQSLMNKTELKLEIVFYKKDGKSKSLLLY